MAIKKEFVIEATKLVGGIAAGVGASQVVLNIAEATLPPNAKASVKIATKIGGVLISTMASGFAYDYVGHNVDTIVEAIDNAMKKGEADPDVEYVTP